jgi:hypothetical protein
MAMMARPAPVWRLRNPGFFSFCSASSARSARNSSTSSSVMSSSRPKAAS